MRLLLLDVFKSEMPFGTASGDIRKAVGDMRLEFKGRGLDQRYKFGIQRYAYR